MILSVSILTKTGLMRALCKWDTLGVLAFAFSVFILFAGAGKAITVTDKARPVYQEFIPKDWRTVQGITVLCYHQVYTNAKSSSAKHNFNISAKNFREQLEYLKGKNYKGIDLPSLYNYLQGGAYPVRNGEKAVVISFDDGTAIFKKAAQPLLREFQFRETHFIAMGLIDKVPGHMKSRQLKDTFLAGGYAQSHGYRHFLMSDFTGKKRTLDILKSRKTLSAFTNLPITHIAYPQGIYTHDMEERLQETGFDAAYTVYHGENIPGHNRAYLNRYLVLQSHGLNGFIERLETRPLPAMAFSPERGSRIKPGQTVTFSLPADINPTQLSITVDNKVLTNAKFTAVQQKEVFRISLSLPHTNKRRIFREVSLNYTENSKKYHHTFMYLK